MLMMVSSRCGDVYVVLVVVGVGVWCMCSISLPFTAVVVLSRLTDRRSDQWYLYADCAMGVSMWFRVCGRHCGIGWMLVMLVVCLCLSSVPGHFPPHCAMSVTMWCWLYVVMVVVGGRCRVVVSCLRCISVFRVCQQVLCLCALRTVT